MLGSWLSAEALEVLRPGQDKRGRTDMLGVAWAKRL